MITLSGPLKVSLDLTSKCNLNCLHCHSALHDSTAQELSTPEMFDLIDIFAKHKVLVIQLGGGEPLLHPDFFGIVEYAKTSGIEVLFSTNGTLVDVSKAARLKQLDFSQVQVSLDGPNPKIHDHFRGVAGAFERALNGIRILSSAGIGVNIACTLTSLNAPYIEDMIKCAISLHAISFRTMVMMPAGRAVNNVDLMLSNSEVGNIIARLRVLRDKYKDSLTIMYDAPFIPKDESKPSGKPLDEIEVYFAGCAAGKRECKVFANGDVVPCALFSSKEMIAGNVRTTSFEKIWFESDLMKKFRLRSYKLINGKCRECKFGYICNGGCPAVAYNLTGMLNIPDPRCEYEGS